VNIKGNNCLPRIEGFISAWRENLKLGLARKLETRLGEKKEKSELSVVKDSKRDL